jgi:hypothetical protein
MKQHWFRGTASGHGMRHAALAGGLMGDSGWWLSARAGPPRFEDIWRSDRALPDTARRVIEEEPRFAGLEIVLGLTDHDSGAANEVPMLARGGDHLVALLAVDAAHVDARSLEAHLADTSRRAHRFCAHAAILVVQATGGPDAFHCFAAMAAARGLPSARRNVLHLLGGVDADALPLFAAWIEAS